VIVLRFITARMLHDLAATVRKCFRIASQWEQARTALLTAIAMYRSMEMTFWLPETEAALAQVEGR